MFVSRVGGEQKVSLKKSEYWTSIHQLARNAKMLNANVALMRMLVFTAY